MAREARGEPLSELAGEEQARDLIGPRVRRHHSGPGRGGGAQTQRPSDPQSPQGREARSRREVRGIHLIHFDFQDSPRAATTKNTTANPNVTSRSTRAVESVPKVIVARRPSLI